MNLSTLEVSIYVVAGLVMLVLMVFPFIAIARASKPGNEE